MMWTNKYLYGPRIDQLIARIGAGSVSDGIAWYLTDILGSVRQLVQSDGTVIHEIAYDSFGQILSETNASAGDRFKYTAREWDALTAQYYYRARYFGPDTGRFTQEDPMRFAAGDSNLYRYVGNSPTNATDPRGLEVRIESTGAALGNHHRITVDVWDENNKRIGTYSISYGKIELRLFRGEVYRDGDPPTATIDKLPTTPAQDRVILLRFQNWVSTRGGYSIIFLNCRIFSRREFERIRAELLNAGLGK